VKRLKLAILYFLVLSLIPSNVAFGAGLADDSYAGAAGRAVGSSVSMNISELTEHGNSESHVYEAYDGSDQFALMYDSAKALAYELSKLPEFEFADLDRGEAGKLIAPRVSAGAILRERAANQQISLDTDAGLGLGIKGTSPLKTAAGSAASAVSGLSEEPTAPLTVSPLEAAKLIGIDETDVKMLAVSLAARGDIKAIVDLASRETAGESAEAGAESTVESVAVEHIRKLAEDAGESRFIVKYKEPGSDRVLANIDINGEADTIAADTELLSFSENINPKELADELKDAGLKDEIEYIQPDFMLNVDSVGINVYEADETGSLQIVQQTVEEDSLVSDGGIQSDENEAIEEATSVSDDEITSADDSVEITVSGAKRQVTVAMIDTAVDTEHPAFSGLLTDGWDFIEGDAYVSEAGMDAAHGTHIAGALAEAAATYGADISIMPLKVFDKGAAYTSDVISAIEYAEQSGAEIINCSFGSSNENPALYEAISGSAALFIAAAGNSRRDLEEIPSYPACFDLPNIISVASLNNDKGFSYYSNYGMNKIDIAAVGREVYGAFPGGGYGNMTGTSMSSAKVSAAAAAVMSLHEGAYEEEDSLIGIAAVKALLLEGADTLPELTNKVSGGRILNTDNAINGAAGEILNISPEEDFDPVGYSKESTDFNTLYSSGLKAIQVEAGNTHALVLMSDGSVYAWGRNASGQLGDGTNEEKEGLVRVIGLNNIVQISAVWDHSLALDKNGNIYAWGDNASGQIGDGTNVDRNVPTQVAGLEDIIDIFAGPNTSFAIDEKGELFSWGANHGGQLGDGTKVSRTFAVKISGIEHVVMVAGGMHHTIALTEDGTIYSWGGNTCGQLGGGASTGRSIPTKVSELSSVRTISAHDNQSFAVLTSGEVYAWGYNEKGRLGDGTTTARKTPTLISGLTGIEKIAAGYSHTLAVSSGDEIYSWGANEYGQLGDGTFQSRSTPTKINGIDSVGRIVSISAAYMCNVALSEEGRVYVWGCNDFGLLGGGLIAKHELRPVKLENVTEISAGKRHSMALIEDGDVYTWGDNTYNQLGVGAAVSHSPVPMKVQGVSEVVQISAGTYNCLALTGGGEVYAWGDNIYGQAGYGDAATPSLINGFMTDIVAVSAGSEHSLALGSDGTVYAWGDNSFNQIGDYSLTMTAVPIIVNGISDIVAIKAGSAFSLALGSNGKVYGWGLNQYGQAGGNDFLQVTAQEIIGLENISMISAGSKHGIALSETGIVYTWGCNDDGQMGNGDISGETGLMNEYFELKNVISVSAGESDSFIMTADGTTYASGSSRHNQLGFSENLTKQFSFAEMGFSGIDVAAAGQEHSIYIIGGDIFSIGSDGSGQLGIGRKAYSELPISLTDYDNFFGEWRGLYFIRDTYELLLGESTTVSAIYTDIYGDTGSGQIVYALSQAKSGVSINSTTGVITATTSAQPGTVTITASCGGKTASAQLIIAADQSAIAFAQSSYSLIAGGNVTVSANYTDPYGNTGSGQIVYVLSQAKSGVSINSTTGVITATSSAQAGTVTITASCGGKTASAQLIIAADQSALTFAQSSYDLTAGGDVTVIATYKNAYGNTATPQGIVYALSSAYSGVSINSSTGKITATSSAQPGTATVTASYGGKTATVSVIIKSNVLTFEQNISVSNAKTYVLDIVGSNLKTMPGAFELTYDNTAFSPVDLCGLSFAKELTSSTAVIAGTGVKITQVTANGTQVTVKFSVNKTIAAQKMWSGSLNVIVLKGKAAKTSKITLKTVG
jgi:alpha-tubulin suppressor-like RCC1 family protein